jgi:hypothetical protein
MEEIQTIYINLDDSGKIIKEEKYCIYAGTVFLSKLEYDKFITQYRSIVEKTKCKYCKKLPEKCSKECPELKNYNLKYKHKRQLLNCTNQFYTVACIIDNNRLREDILTENASRKRYVDYAIKITIKSVIKDLIKTGKINPEKPVKLILNIDQEATKSNGYYSLDEGIKEELVHGVSNFNYGIYHKPILFGGFSIRLKYLCSNTSYPIQGADLVAGTIRRSLLYYENDTVNLNKDLEFVTFKKFLP